MFNSARWRLTLWYAGMMLVILIALGLVVSVVAKKALLDAAEGDLRSRADRDAGPLALRVVDALRRGASPPDISIASTFTAGGYFYALVDPQGNNIASTQNLDPAGLVNTDELQRTLERGPRFVDTSTSDDEELMVYLVPFSSPRGDFVLEVGRSIEPELGAVRRLNIILGLGAGGGALLALVGGYLLAGLTLRPIGRALDRQRAFVADASHELRTPLALIRANTEMVRRHPEQTIGNQPLLDDIIRDTDHLAAIVAQMQTLTLADSERVPFEREPLDLSQLVQDVGRQAQQLAAAKALEVQVEAGEGMAVEGDRVRLRELLLILIDNAIKYTPPGGWLRLSLAQHGDKTRLIVSDSGQGIPAEALPHVFERFYRVDKARSRTEGSAGLGLSIARWIVENHGGTIAVESPPGAGAAFTIELPLSRQPVPVPGLASTP